MQKDKTKFDYWWVVIDYYNHETYSEELEVEKGQGPVILAACKVEHPQDVKTFILERL